MENRMLMKGKNRNNIYKLIYDSEGISKQDIARTLNLSLPTVSQNLAELKEKGLITEDGTFESTGGRKARVICSVAGGSGHGYYQKSRQSGNRGFKRIRFAQQPYPV